MSEAEKLRERIKQQINWWTLLWECDPGEFCGAAFERNYLVGEAGDYRGVRLRMTEEPPHVWVDTRTGSVEAIDGEHECVEALDDFLDNGTNLINWWLNTLWVTAWDDDEREQFDVTVIAEAADRRQGDETP